LSQPLHIQLEAEEETTTGLSHRKLLIWAFLASECMFFGSLIATYLVMRGRSLDGPCPGDTIMPDGTLCEGILSIPVTSVSTFALLASSMAMVLAYSSLTRGNIRGFRIWILCTALLGATFLGFQVFEFREFVEAGLTPRTSVFGSSFFVLTGFHGAHVTVGVIWLLSLFGYSVFRGGVTPEKSINVDMAALYWHFVDIVWIVIFTVVYLLGVAV
jgi:cytochrome c oxidase subunit 3